jgi:uncharacterized membrane protein YfcA
VALTLTPGFLAAVAVVLLVAGVVNGVAGFGFALVGTMALASAFDRPATAVVFMILPIFAVNLSLVRDLSTAELRSCGARFAPLMVTALAGTLVGLVVVDRVPAGPLKAGLGAVTLAFVATAQRRVSIPGIDALKGRCFVETTPAMLGIGAVSGLLFGGTNVGVPLITYVRSFDLSHGVFVGVVAMVFLGLNGVRVAAAGALGLYPSLAVVGLSLVATVPAVTGVVVGKRLRSRVAESHRRVVVLALLTVIGIRLVLGGLGVA